MLFHYRNGRVIIYNYINYTYVRNRTQSPPLLWTIRDETVVEEWWATCNHRVVFSISQWARL